MKDGNDDECNRDRDAVLCQRGERGWESLKERLKLARKGGLTNPAQPEAREGNSTCVPAI